jgi:hypothetical protein
MGANMGGSMAASSSTAATAHPQGCTAIQVVGTTVVAGAGDMTAGGATAAVVVAGAGIAVVMAAAAEGMAVMSTVGAEGGTVGVTHPLLGPLMDHREAVLGPMVSNTGLPTRPPTQVQVHSQQGTSSHTTSTAARGHTLHNRQHTRMARGTSSRRKPRLRMAGLPPEEGEETPGGAHHQVRESRGLCAGCAE